jgi:hypothetical protein
LNDDGRTLGGSSYKPAPDRARAAARHAAIAPDLGGSLVLAIALARAAVGPFARPACAVALLWGGGGGDARAAAPRLDADTPSFPSCAFALAVAAPPFARRRPGTSDDPPESPAWRLF